MKEKVKKLARFLLNPRLVLCLAIAWCITNGWAYMCVIVGTLLNQAWLIEIPLAYLLILWIPFTPEKIITIAIAIFLMRILFPHDEKTMLVLRQIKASVLPRKKKDGKNLKDKKSEESDYEKS